MFDTLTTQRLINHGAGKTPTLQKVRSRIRRSACEREQRAQETAETAAADARCPALGVVNQLVTVVAGGGRMSDLRANWSNSLTLVGYSGGWSGMTGWKTGPAEAWREGALQQECRGVA